MIPTNRNKRRPTARHNLFIVQGQNYDGHDFSSSGRIWGSVGGGGVRKKITDAFDSTE